MIKYDVNSLSIDEKIGQLIMFGFDALEVNNHAIKLIRDYKVGNVILFARNVKTPEQVFKLNQNLQKLAFDNIGIPLFISIDQEGGMVTRIKNGATFFPGAMTLAASNNINNAYLTGQYMGIELKSLGINFNLAPVLDTNNNPKNPVIGVRSYSDNPKTVSDFGNAFIKGLQESVIATGKHFPGHGDTNVDSHLALPTIEYGVDRLEKIELYPFKQAIKSGLKAIMSAHINFPAFTENGLPTTLSKKCLTGLLRDKLGFEGIIVTDCMQMKAIQHNYTTKEGTLMAINAGANLVCISHAEELQVASVKRLKEAVATGELTEDTINDRVSRLLKFKEELGDVHLTNTYESVSSLVENKNTKEFVLNVVKSAATLVKGKPFIKKDIPLILAVSPMATTIADEKDGSHDIINRVRLDLPDFDTARLNVKTTEMEIEEALKQAKNHKQVIICTYNANIYTSQIDLVKLLAKEDLELHVIAMRNPYDLHYAKEIENLVCFYEYTPNSISALVDYLKGDLTLKGKLPITSE